MRWRREGVIPAAVLGIAAMSCSGAPLDPARAEVQPGIGNPARAAGETLERDGRSRVVANGPASRVLPRTATFADLTRALREASALRAGERADCVLEGARTAGARARVRAPAAVGPGEPLSAPPLAADLAAARPPVELAIATPDGAASPGHPDLVITTLTPVSPAFARASPIAVLFADAEVLRFTSVLSHGSIGGDRWVVLDAAETERFRQHVALRAVAVVVTADRDTPIAMVREALALVNGAPAEVAIGELVDLTASELPTGPRDALEALDPATPSPTACPLGIRTAPPSSNPGSLTGSTFRVAQEFERAIVDGCGGAMGPGAGGEITLALRVLADGRPSEACVQRDYVGIETVRTCARTRALAFRFPELRGGDYLDVALPARLPPRGLPLAALCD